MHAVWHRAASLVLGLTPSEYHGADYIDSMVIWRRKNIEKMISHIERDGENWYGKLIRAGDFSEYVLYGVFYDNILGDQGEQTPTPRRQSLTLWDTAAAHSADQKIDSLAHDQLAIVIQSTIDIADSERRRIVERAIDKAAEQDGRL